MRAILASMLMLLAVEPAKAAPVSYAETHIEANWNIDNINSADPFSFVFFSAIYLPYDPELTALRNLDFRIVFKPGRAPRFFGPDFVPAVQNIALGYPGYGAQANGLLPDGPNQQLQGTLRISHDENGDLTNLVFRGPGGFSIVDGAAKLKGVTTSATPIEQSLFFFDNSIPARTKFFDLGGSASGQNDHQGSAGIATPAPIPLPASISVLMLALGALGLTSRRTRRAPA